MQAFRLEKGKLIQKSVPEPIPAPGEVLVQVRKAGICKTDLELAKGYMGFEGTLGHEFVGTVCQSAEEKWLDKRVCGEINFGCGQCATCVKGLARHCPNRSVLGILNQDGAFAEMVIVPITNLRQIPDEVTDIQAVFVEPLAAAFEILEQVTIRPNDKVAVIGDGKLGLLISQVLKLTGCDLALIGKHENKLALARRWQIKTVQLVENDFPQFDIVVEASGSASGFSAAMALLRPRGTMVLKSTYAGNLEFNAAPIVINEVTIIGSRCGLFEPAVRALQKKIVQVDDLVEATYNFTEMFAAFEHAGKSGTLKVLVNV